MPTPTQRTALFSVLAIGVLIGCDDGAGPGEVLDNFDAPAVTAANNALVAPLQASAEATAVLRDAFPTLADSGVVFDRSGGVDRVPGRTGFPLVDILEQVEIPPDLLGSTFVYTQQIGWEVDPDRTGAPDNAVRVVWYDTDPSGSILFPTTEVGYMDLTDQSNVAAEQLGLRIVNSTGESTVVVAQLVQSYTTSPETQWEDHFEAVGMYSDGVNSVEFELSSDASGDDQTGDQQYTLDVSMVGQAASFELSTTGVVDGATETTDEDLTATVTTEGATTTLDLDIVVETLSEEGNGTLSHMGTAIADVSIASGNFDFTSTSGGQFSSRQEGELENLVRSMYLNGYIVLVNLPLLFL